MNKNHDVTVVYFSSLSLVFCPEHQSAIRTALTFKLKSGFSMHACSLQFNLSGAYKVSLSLLVLLLMTKQTNKQTNKKFVFFSVKRI